MSDIVFSPSTAPGEVTQYGAVADVGCHSLSERRGLSGQSMAQSGTMWLTFFRAPKSFTANNVQVACTTAAGATPTLVRVGLYSVAANGDITLIGSIANDTAIFAANNTAYTRALTAPVALQQGTWYATGLLVVTAAALPLALGISVAGGVTFVPTALAPRLAGTIAGQADLPGTVASASVLASNLSFWTAVTI